MTNVHCLVRVFQVDYKCQILPSILFSSIGGLEGVKEGESVLCFCHNFEKTIALNSDKSLQTSNPSSRLTNFLLKQNIARIANPALQSYVNHFFVKSYVNHIFHLIVPFPLLVSLVCAVSLVFLVIFVSVV